MIKNTFPAAWETMQMNYYGSSNKASTLGIIIFVSIILIIILITMWIFRFHISDMIKEHRRFKYGLTCRLCAHEHSNKCKKCRKKRYLKYS